MLSYIFIQKMLSIFEVVYYDDTIKKRFVVIRVKIEKHISNNFIEFWAISSFIPIIFIEKKINLLF